MSGTIARTIFIVDDDAEIRTLTARLLQREGHRVITCADVAAMTVALARSRPDVILLDRMMPGVEGADACRALRDDGDDIPVILLTALGETEARVVGLSAGADDYIVKPFDPRELLLRIEAVLRRRVVEAALPAIDARPVSFGRCRLDPVSRCLTVDGVETILTDAEFALLRTLAERLGRPVSRLRLAEATGRPEIGDRSIDVAVHRLRRLIEVDPAAPRMLQTVRGLGYVLVG